MLCETSGQGVRWVVAYKAAVGLLSASTNHRTKRNAPLMKDRAKAEMTYATSMLGKPRLEPMSAKKTECRIAARKSVRYLARDVEKPAVFAARSGRLHRPSSFVTCSTSSVPVPILGTR